jgi:hypothetical protein
MNFDSRQLEAYRLAVRRLSQGCASHQFEPRPIFTKEICCVLMTGRQHSNAAAFSAAAVRYLKIKSIFACFPMLVCPKPIAAHAVSPCLVTHLMFPNSACLQCAAKTVRSRERRAANSRMPRPNKGNMILVKIEVDAGEAGAS